MHRSRGNVISAATIGVVAEAVVEQCVSLVMVVGHSHCAAVQLGISRWLERSSCDLPDMRPLTYQERRKSAHMRLPPAEEYKGIDRVSSALWSSLDLPRVVQWRPPPSGAHYLPNKRSTSIGVHVTRVGDILGYEEGVMYPDRSLEKIACVHIAFL